MNYIIILVLKNTHDGSRLYTHKMKNILMANQGIFYLTTSKLKDIFIFSYTKQL